MITVRNTVAHVHFARLTEGGGHFFPDETRYLQRPHGILVCVCVANVWGPLEAVFHRLRHTRNSCSSPTFPLTQGTLINAFRTDVSHLSLT